MAEDKRLFTTLVQETTPRKPAPPPPPPVIDQDDDEDVGSCAAIAKNKWVTALTLKHRSGKWESFQYRHMAVRSTFEPTRFEVFFVGDHDKWKVVVTGRNLERIYNLVIQHRLEWVKAVDRDFGDDDKGVITNVEASLVTAEEVGMTDGEQRTSELTHAMKLRPKGTEPSAGR